MPIYEYRCRKCDNKFEVQQSFGDDPVKCCAAEGCSGRVTKVFSPPAIIFKGKGFHVNDYGRGNGGGRSSDTSKSSESEKASEKATETAASTKPKETEKVAAGGE